MSIRHDWYQTDEKVVVTVCLKNADGKNYKVNIETQSLCMTADDYELYLHLNAPVDVEKCFDKVFPSKVEITLVKAAFSHWPTLEAVQVPTTSESGPPKLHKKDWDTLAKEAEQAEEKEAHSEDALQRLFKRIYSTSNPEVQKAMNKSFSESGGTVLSTNWEQVGSGTVDVKPPQGTEFKKWD